MLKYVQYYGVILTFTEQMENLDQVMDARLNSKTKLQQSIHFDL